MKLYTGTSGFSYKEWKGSFYPEKLPAKDMLAHYGGRLSAVEINNTFYRMPRESMLEGWREKVPESFRFVIKASQQITHRARLKDCRDSVDYLWKCCGALGERLGPLLFQLPPNFKKDAERLETFLGWIPEGCRAAFEFRNPTWFDDEVVELLRRAGAVLVAADIDPEAPPRVERTADWGYLRLRREAYTPAELDAWCERVRAAGWDEAFVFFKHEDEATGPRLAEDFAGRFASA